MTLASIVWDVDPVLVHWGQIELRWYGLMWGLGFILAYEIVSRLFKKEGYPDNWADKLFVYCIVSVGLLQCQSGRDSEDMERRACQPWRRVPPDTGIGVVFQESNQEKRLVAFRPDDTCRSRGMYVHPLWQPDEFGDIRLSYYSALGIRVCPFARVAGIV